MNVPGLLDPAPPPPALTAECAALPERGIDPRLLEIATGLAEAPGVEERIARTLALVSTRRRYSLEPGGRRDGLVAEFFFEKRRGCCQYFASAAVVLLHA